MNESTNSDLETIATANLWRSAQLDVVEKEYANRINYARTIIFAGYGGYWGLWAITSDVTTVFIKSTSAALIGISLVIYSSWEIYASIKNIDSLNKYQNIVNKISQGKINREKFLEYRICSANQYLKYNEMWRIVFLLSVSFGYSGALMLLSGLIYAAFSDIFW